MDQKKQFLILLGALILIIILIIVVPGPNFGQINLVGNNEESIQTNILQDSTLSLSQNMWEVSTSAFTNSVDETGTHILSTSPTGLTLTQSVSDTSLSSAGTLRVQGALRSTTDRDTFFISILDSESRELSREQVSPLNTFSFEKALSNEERIRLQSGEIQIALELPGSATYTVENITLSAY